ncbi:hypothetical protein RN001_001380 [Aquatica leii]|uniref:Uncharacterized protein n=1 Tax=Aquatica leii TaxID=1421715 RepID=A0AAN7Q3Z4_9COLE|nr:hypothetical protein RN001_001380 [Aquatica leii]
MSNEKLPLSVKLQTIMLRYRATPLIDGKSPAENYLHRKIRIRLDSILPYFENNTNSTTPSVRSLQEGERVLAKFFSNNKVIWKPGTVMKKFGKLHYLVELDDGYKLKRHINQLQKSKLKSVKFQEDISEPFRYVPDEEDAHFQTTPVPDPPIPEPPVPNITVADTETPIPELRRSGRTINQSVKLNDYILG